MTENFTFAEIKPETCFVPQTHKEKGRNISVKPDATAARLTCVTGALFSMRAMKR